MGIYLGEIRIFAGSFAPEGWALCNGQALLISQYKELYQLIGTTYGGDGQRHFSLPDLRGRIPVHQSTDPTFSVGAKGGVETVTLSSEQMPVHRHTLVASAIQATLPDPGNNVLARSGTAGVSLYTNETPDTQLHGDTVAPEGKGQPHENRAPYLCVNHIIALSGTYPVRAAP